jgi:large subunit ribosomal protein L12
MEYVYAAMLLNKAGKDISADALTKTLSAAGISVDEARVKATAAALVDVDINKVIEETQLTSASAAPAAPAASADAAEESPAEAKEEKTEASEEDVSEGLGALFG